MKVRSRPRVRRGDLVRLRYDFETALGNRVPRGIRGEVTGGPLFDKWGPEERMWLVTLYKAVPYRSWIPKGQKRKPVAVWWLPERLLGVYRHGDPDRYRYLVGAGPLYPARPRR